MVPVPQFGNHKRCSHVPVVTLHVSYVTFPEANSLSRLYLATLLVQQTSSTVTTATEVLLPLKRSKFFGLISMDLVIRVMIWAIIRFKTHTKSRTSLDISYLEFNVKLWRRYNISSEKLIAYILKPKTHFAK